MVKDNVIFKLVKNEKELENVLRQIANLRKRGIKPEEILKRVFNLRDEEVKKWFGWIMGTISWISRKGLENLIEEYKQRYREFKEKEKDKPKEKKTGKKEDKTEKKTTRRKKTTEEKLEDAAESAVERKLLDHIRKISLEQLREVIENGLLVKEYEEQLRQEAIEQYKRAYISERARRELLNEALFMFLSGLIDRRTLAQIVLSILLDEMIEPKMFVIPKVENVKKPKRKAKSKPKKEHKEEPKKEPEYVSTLEEPKISFIVVGGEPDGGKESAN